MQHSASFWLPVCDTTLQAFLQNPKTDQAKRSIPGEVAVRLVDGVPTVFPAEEVDAADNLLVTVYNRGPVEV